MMSTTGLIGCPPLICQTTQTTTTSASLPGLPKTLGAQSQPTTITSLVISSPSLPITTPKTQTTNNNRKESSNTKNKHLVVNRTNGLFEGSHIHYSPIDNKPLCSYSTKLCKQRRINGYAFCIRHILEDPSAPFRQCKHVAKYNQQKCSNAIPANEDRLFCNSHMQIAGMAPKKERKDKKELSGHSVGTNTNLLSTKTNGICQTINIKNVSGVGNGFALKTKPEIILKSEKTANFDAFIKPPVKLNGITNTVNANIIQKLNDNLQKKSSDKCTATTEMLPLNETSISSHKNNFKLNNFNSNQIKTESNTESNNNIESNDKPTNISASKPKPKRKKKDKKTIDKFVFARKKKSGDNLFNYHIWLESDDETDDETNILVRRHLKNDTSVGDEMFPLIFGTLSTNIVDLEPNELKNELISQKWLLKDLIDVRKKDFTPQLESTRAILKTLNTTPMKRYSYLDYKLSESSRRSENSIRKGICCYSSDETRCRRPSLPFTRHCIEHILYNVDQLLFARCTAKCAKTMTQCSHSTFDIINEEPLCNYHQIVGSEVEERSVSPMTDSKNKKRRKSKPMALTRISRRGKKRRKGPNGTDIPVIVEDSIDRLSIGSIDDDSLHSHSDTNDITINLLAQKPDHNQSTDIVNHTITTAIPQTTTSAAIVASPVVAPELPLMRLPSLLPPVVTCEPPVVPMGPVVVLDHSMPPPPPLEPTEEALVASIVADLPQLTTDADFTEVLNKIPDDFSDFLLEHPNGDIPSTEETEALEQALAMVNKDVQNLVAVAGMNGNNNSGAQMSDFGGQSDIIGFTNWLGSLTSEQRQQLNGLIDGAIASNSLSPILKNACDAYPSQMTLPSTVPPIMKTSANYVTGVHSQNTAFPAIYSNLGPTPQQEFVPISTPVPTLLNNNLLMNGLSSHPS